MENNQDTSRWGVELSVLGSRAILLPFGPSALEANSFLPAPSGKTVTAAKNHRARAPLQHCLGLSTSSLTVVAARRAYLYSLQPSTASMSLRRSWPVSTKSLD